LASPVLCVSSALVLRSSLEAWRFSRALHLAHIATAATSNRCNHISCL
jgi:hypothetical protein